MGEKSPQGLDLQRKRRGKKNFSGPGKRFLSQSAGKALRQSLSGLPAGAVLLPVAGSDAGQNEGEGAWDPFPISFISWASARSQAAAARPLPVRRNARAAGLRTCV